VAWLRDLTAEAQRGQTVVFALPGADPVPLFPSPVVVAIPEPSDAGIKAVLEDLTLTPEKLAGENFWRYATWSDTPILLAGTARLAPSGALTAPSVGDDHMLRLAVLVDEAQYVKVSGAREARMIRVCQDVLEPLGWAVTSRRRSSAGWGSGDSRTSMRLAGSRRRPSRS
jgi:hypothetical protein